jgi:hypothetical protein
MGWWKPQGTSEVVGDVPLDLLAGAVNRVVDEYRAEFERSPTRAEWEALLRIVLENPDAQPPRLNEPGQVVAVRIETDVGENPS